MSPRADKEQRKRDLMAIGFALLIHLIIVAGFIISHFVFYSDVVEYRGPVLVKLGRMDAPDEETDKQPSLPENSEDKQVSTENQETESTEELKSGETAESVKSDESEDKTVRETPNTETDNGDRGDSETSSEKTSDTSSSNREDIPSAEAEETVTVTKGSEEGNAYETTYDSSPGLVGRNWWIPIYMYMPIPQYVDKIIFDSIKGDDELANRPGTRTREKKIEFFLTYYSLLGDEYYLKNPPNEIDERPQIWSILEDGQYNMKKAEYKEGRTLKTVTITFVITAEDDETAITDANINRSSGYGEIDAAVMYGFKKASFYNSSDDSVKGQFTYRFD